MSFTPAYMALVESGELVRRVGAAYKRLAACDLCAWGCGVDRTAGQLGQCHTGIRARVSSYGPHHGEEPPLSGWRGSGTIFFSRCNLHCAYCQNFTISQADEGDEVEPEDLAAMMLELQARGCHNINFVSPSHVIAPILAGVTIAARAGLRLPLVFNTGGYDALATLGLLDGVIDIYMPDMKYSDAAIARRYSGCPHYPAVNCAAVKEMHRQVGDLQLDERGLATRGLLVRHLVLPNGLAGTEEVMRFLAEEVSPRTYLNLMDQYRPCYRAGQYPDTNRRITREEYQQARLAAMSRGNFRLD